MGDYNFSSQAETTLNFGPEFDSTDLLTLKIPISFVVPARISNQSRVHCWRSPLPLASALIQRDFGCVLGVQQTKQLPHVAKVDLV
ncbi:hypothetical protein TNCV_3948591 [Trichonephila clavipes]|nr:hypothetical protein TNCV_3948591 [Trichonephila clavipes]